MKKFITFEGIDCSGKTTQIELLKDRLIDEKQKVYIVRDPGGTEVSESIRKIILDTNNSINDKTEMLLFLAARSQLVQNIILPKLKSNYFVICDRFTDSTLAYQGYGRKININLINSLNKLVTFGLKPSVTFFLDINIEILKERKEERKQDRMELSSIEFYKRVRNGYLDIASRLSNRIIKLNGNKTINLINEQIWEKIENLYLRKK